MTLTEQINSAITFLKTRDLEVTTAFYQDVLGLRLALDQGACRIFQLRPGAYLGFCQTDAPTGSPEVIVTLVVDDVDGACDQMEVSGAVIEVRPRYNERFKIYQFFARDPNGYLLEVQRFEDPAWKGEGMEQR
jgi:catechol 2,3-dioxygenase-like lactoylglutathione lyase family enzyme